MNKGNKVVYTPHEVAEKLGISLNTVYRQMRAGKIPHVKVGWIYLISKDAFDKWLSDGKNAPGAG